MSRRASLCGNITPARLWPRPGPRPITLSIELLGLGESGNSVKNFTGLVCVKLPLE